MRIFQEAARLLQRYSDQHETVLVGYSGGKDSLATLDLCVKAFRRVVPYFFYYVPGLEVDAANLRYARDRFGLDVLCLPDPTLIEDVRDGFYGFHIPYLHSLKFSAPLEALVRAETGIDLVATGRKKTDAMGRGLANLALSKRDRNQLMPLLNWNKWDVLAYLKANNLRLPESDGRNSASIDLSFDCLSWLHDKHPADFARMQAYFPFIPAAILRRDLFSLKAQAGQPASGASGGKKRQRKHK